MLLTSRPCAPTARNFNSRSGNTFALRSFTISSAPPNGAITSTTHSRSPDFPVPLPLVGRGWGWGPSRETETCPNLTSRRVWAKRDRTKAPPQRQLAREMRGSPPAPRGCARRTAPSLLRRCGSIRPETALEQHRENRHADNQACFSVRPKRYSLDKSIAISRHSRHQSLLRYRQEAALPSSLAQAFLLVAQQRRQHVLDDAARAGLDLDRHRHPGREIDQPALDLHLPAVE